jgi:hypothetical protein
MPFRPGLWPRLILPNLEDAPRRNPGGGRNDKTAGNATQPGQNPN